jgi:hypothetical protein
MENLYSFSKNAWHVQFFKWMWNVNPVEKYKTMCPYFWQFVGSIIILPAILFWKIIDCLIPPIDKWIDSVNENSHQKQMNHLLFKFHSAELIRDKYVLWKSKCWRNYSDSLLNVGSITNEEYKEFRREAFSYELALEEKQNYKKAKQQVQIDNIRYGVIGKILLWALTFVIIYYSFIVINWFVHLFTFAQFIEVLIIILILILSLALVFIIVALWTLFNDNCKKDFTKFNPFIYIGKFFKGIWKIFMIIIDMIINLYKQSCPTITWK